MYVKLFTGATERHLPYGITQCCLPRNTCEYDPF